MPKNAAKRIDFQDESSSDELCQRMLSGGTFEIGQSSFMADAARFDDLSVAREEMPDSKAFGVLTTMRVSRFLDIANASAFSHDALPQIEPLRVPSILLFTNDNRKTFQADLAGGIADALRFRAENGPDTDLPVILFLENNQVLVKSEAIDENLQRKLARGVYPRLRNEARFFIDGPSFSGLRH